MKPEYAAWIESYVAAQPSRFVRGKCAAATLALVAAFPELRRVAGFAQARRRVPTGVCMDCGDDVYESKTFCSDACERATRSYLGF